METVRYRYWSAQALSYGAGVLCALWLHGALKPPVQWLPKPKSVAVRVAVKSPAPAAPAESSPVAPTVSAAPAPAPVAAKPKVLPLRGESSSDKPTKPAKSTASMPGAKPIEQTAPAQPLMPEQPLPTLSQPSIAPPATQVAELPRIGPSVPQVTELPPVLPPVPSGPLPPMPPEGDIKTYPEEPGGNVLVLELTVNDQGRVVDSRILVPSANALSDLTLALASQGQYWTQLEPPMAPGELRKLEVRIPYADDKPATPLP